MITHGYRKDTVYLRKKEIYPVDYCITTIGKHHLLVIGRVEGSNIYEMDAWGDNAVVCDPWADKVYPVTKFKEMQLPKHDVKYATYGPPQPPPPPYLAGRMEVMWSSLDAENLVNPSTKIGLGCARVFSSMVVNFFVNTGGLTAETGRIPGTTTREIKQKIIIGGFCLK